MSARRIHPQPRMQPVEGTADLWVLLEAYTYADARLGRTITIPADFRWNRASVPRAAAPLVTRDDLGEVAALLHDWPYGTGGVLPDGTRITRAEADALFHRVMLLDGVVPWKANVAYAGVRLRGWAHWAGDGARVQATMQPTMQATFGRAG